MKLFSLYYIVQVTWFILSFYGTETISEKSVNPSQGYQLKAFPQSKDINIHKSFKLKSSDLHLVKSALIKLLHEMIASQKNKKRAIRSKISKSTSVLDSKSKRYLKPSWDHWTDWSACSVSCGKGRNIRWRHCAQNCAGVETEMEEKVCQLPACGGKLFGFIKL